MDSKVWALAIPFAAAMAWMTSPALADRKPEAAREVAAEVRTLEGTYTGSWTMFGVNDKGDVVKRTAWTDVMKAVRPEVKGDRAYVSTTDDMTFEGLAGSQRTFTVQGIEGYLLNKDGSLGDYFFESAGDTHRMTKVGENVWSCTTPIVSQEVSRLGFPADASGQHVLVKVVTREQGAETHRVSRLTTVQWRDKEGKERALQYVSLQGHHRRHP